MDPPSPSKLGNAPPWNQEQSGPPLPLSSSTPILSAIPPGSPTRRHQRTGSDVSVTSLAAKFENLGVKDHEEVARRYKQQLDEEKRKYKERLQEHERKHALVLERKAVRIEELESDLAQAKVSLQAGVSRQDYEKEFMAHKTAIKKWEKVFKERHDQWNADHLRVKALERDNKDAELRYNHYKAKNKQLTIENLKVTSMVPTMQGKVQGLEREKQRIKSDLDHKTREADMYKNQLYSLQVELEGTTARLEEEMQTLKDRLRSTEGERDALKTSLKEEEVLRIAAEGHIPLPATSADEDQDEFASPVRFPRKQRTVQRQDDDKENVAPKKAMVELKHLQDKLATERRLRERAEDQIDFMKMECQFQCCSCRIAENKGKKYVHDDAFMVEMLRIQASVPGLTPPASVHEDDSMDRFVIKQEPVEDTSFTDPIEEVPLVEGEEDSSCPRPETDGLIASHISGPDAMVAFSPSTGTFRAVPSPVKSHASSQDSTPLQHPNLGFSAVTETISKSSPWAADVRATVMPDGVFSTPVSRRSAQKEKKMPYINIHEDAIDDEEDDEPAQFTPRQEPSNPETPARYELHTTTTTVPIAFSPATPAFRPGRGPMTPSTVAHAASSAATPVLGEMILNKAHLVGEEREKALQAIRERRGRTQSMNVGHGTPLKQMMEKDRRDISAPVPRGRR